MATAYEFTKPDNTMVQRSSDLAFLPWDLSNNCPAGEGFAFRQWLNDGSPIPSPYDPAKWPTPGTTRR